MVPNFGSPCPWYSRRTCGRDHRVGSGSWMVTTTTVVRPPTGAGPSAVPRGDSETPGVNLRIRTTENRRRRGFTGLLSVSCYLSSPHHRPFPPGTRGQGGSRSHGTTTRRRHGWSRGLGPAPPISTATPERPSARSRAWVSGATGPSPGPCAGRDRVHRPLSPGDVRPVSSVSDTRPGPRDLVSDESHVIPDPSVPLNRPGS